MREVPSVPAKLDPQLRNFLSAVREAVNSALANVGSINKQVTVINQALAPVSTDAPSLIDDDEITRSLTGANGADGAAGINARTVSLTSTTQAFTYDSLGTTPTPSTATLTATALNTVGTVYYEFFLNDVSTGVASIVNTYTYTPPASFANVPDKLEVQIREGSGAGPILARDQITLFGLQAGAHGITVILSNDNHSLPKTAAGVVNYTGSGTTIEVYEGSTKLTEDSTIPFANGTFRVTALPINVTLGTVTGTGTQTLTYGDASAMIANPASIRFAITVIRADGAGLLLQQKQSLSFSIEGASGSGSRAPTHLYISGTSWSDVAADAAFTALSLTKMDKDRVTISGTGFAMVKYWDSGTSAWIADGAVINGNLIVTNTITSSQINANGLTIRDPSGNVILDASGLGGNIDYANVANVGGNSANLLPLSDFRMQAITAITYWKHAQISGTTVPYTSAYSGELYLLRLAGLLAGSSMVYAPGIQIIPGVRYELSGYLGTALATANIKISVNVLNASSTILYSNSTATVTTPINTAAPKIQDFTRVGLFFTAPAGSDRAFILIEETHAASVDTYATRLYFGVASVNQTSYTDWSLSPGAIIGKDLGGTFTTANIPVYMPSAVIGTAQITDLSATKITAGSITVGVGLGASGYINSGQTAFNTGTGFWLEGGATPKFSFGNSTNNINWNGSALSVNGSVIGTTNIVPNALSLNKVSTSNFDSYLALPSPVINESHSGGFITTGSEGALSVLSAIGTGTYDQTVTLTITCTCTVSSFEATPGYIKFKLYDNSALTTLAMRFFTPNDRTSAYDYDISATPRATSYTTFEMSYTGTFPASASHTLTFQASIVTGRAGYSWTYEPFISKPTISIVGTQR